MVKAFIFVGLLVFIMLACWVILIMIEAKDNGGGLPYDWWDDEEKDQE